jgi:hypothetical protein
VRGVDGEDFAVYVGYGVFGWGMEGFHDWNLWEEGKWVRGLLFR